MHVQVANGERTARWLSGYGAMSMRRATSRSGCIGKGAIVADDLGDGSDIGTPAFPAAIVWNALWMRERSTFVKEVGG